MEVFKSLLVLFCTVAVTFAANCVTIKAGTTSLNVRSGPSTGYSVLGTVRGGDVLTSLAACSGSWCRVLFTGKTAYVFQSYVTGPSACNTGSSQCVCVVVASLNVRSSAAITNNILGQVSNGQCLPSPQACAGSWCKVTYNNRVAYISSSSRYVTPRAPCSGAAPSPPVTGTGSCSAVTEVVSRSGWGARAARSSSVMSTPVSTVFIHHTVTSRCFSRASCILEARKVQNIHMDDRGFSDIGYNFLVGEDGRAYEGRGWNKRGAHTCQSKTCTCNSKAVAIALLGNFEPAEGGTTVTDAMMTTVRNLVDCAVQGGYVVSWSSLNILGHRDLCSTVCPGITAYNKIKTWAEYGRVSNPCTC